MDKRFVYPSFSGIATFLRSPYILPEEASAGEYIVVGAPYDTTIGSRPGARYAPNAIRQESIHFLYHLTAIDGEVIDVVTKKRMKSNMIGVVKDAGDLRVYPSNVAKTTESISKGIEQIVSANAFPVTLGGDHYIAYPVVKGFEKGMKKRLGRKPKIGYIHVDSHLDAYNENDTWGKYYHGSPARRISELESINVSNMVWVGINGTTGIEAYNFVMNNGGTIITTEDIHKIGVPETIKKAVEIAGEGCDTIYVTMDIDVVDQAYACGTGSFIYGGITATEFLQIASELSKYKNIGGIDIVEVAPNLDLTQNTSRLAATAITSFLKPRIFEFVE